MDCGFIKAKSCWHRGRTAMKWRTNFGLESRQGTKHMVLDVFFLFLFFLLSTIITDSGQRFLLICTKSLDWNPQPSAIGWQCKQMSAEWAELKTCLEKGFETSRAQPEQDEEKASEKSRARFCGGQNGGAFCKQPFFITTKTVTQTRVFLLFVTGCYLLAKLENWQIFWNIKLVII